MQPAGPPARISSVWLVARRWALLTLTALLLVVSGACAVDGTAEMSATDAERPAEPASAGTDYFDDSSPFPLLVPSFGFDTYSGDCEIGDDPFSACQ